MKMIKIVEKLMNMPRVLLSILIMLSFLSNTACTSLEQPENKPLLEENVEKFAAQQKDDIAGGELPSFVLTPELLYQILAGDISAQRGQGDQGVAEWLTIAQQTQDARAAKHAALIALRAKDFSAIEKSATLWVKLAPQSLTARRLLVIALLQNKKIPEIIPHVQMLLKAKPSDAAGFFVQFPLLLGQVTNNNAMIDTVEVLTKPYRALPEAKFTLAYARQINGQSDEAIRLLNEALRQVPQFQAAIDLRQAIINDPLLKSDQKNTFNKQENLLRARILTQKGDFKNAEEIYKMLLADNAQDIAVLYGYGLLRWQQADLDAAKKMLLMVEAARPAYLDEVHFYLGRIAEQEGDFVAAQNWYKKGLSGPLKTENEQALMIVLAKSGQIKEALTYLAHLRKVTETEKIRYAQLHAQIYSVIKAYDKAIKVLNDAVAQSPLAADLYYDRGIAFERLGDQIKSEADLRKALSIQPDNPIFLNGLGFLLIDNNKNLTEATDLLNRALDIMPNSPYIEDSVAWLLYRQGKIKAAEEKLRQVFAIYKDPEVIAHLVEVLWVQKKYQEAKSILAIGLKLYPDSDFLSETIKRLNIQ